MDGFSFAAFAAALVFIGISQIGLWFVLVQVVQQQGRILLRLDGLQQQVDGASRNVLPVIPVSPQPAGVEVGAPIGDFELPDLVGRLVGPKAWRGMRALLVHWSTACGYCDLIAPDLARLDDDLRARNVRLVLVSHGDAESNRRLAEEFGLKCPILLQSDAGPISAFQQLGTPVAYLVDENGCVSEPLVAGADAVLDLARRLALPVDNARRHLPGERPLSESRIERNGLKPGTRAPEFSLPDIYGQSVSLEDYRGRRVLLVFTDPHCGPCDALAPELGRLTNIGPKQGLHVVVIGRGEREENRRKAEEFHLTCAVALQKRWEISKAYGIFATPVGYLIDEAGVIVRDVAMGSEAIVALAQEGLTVLSQKELANGRAVR